MTTKAWILASILSLTAAAQEICPNKKPSAVMPTNTDLAQKILASNLGVHAGRTVELKQNCEIKIYAGTDDQGEPATRGEFFYPAGPPRHWRATQGILWPTPPADQLAVNEPSHTLEYRPSSETKKVILAYDAVTLRITSVRELGSEELCVLEN